VLSCRAESRAKNPGPFVGMNTSSRRPRTAAAFRPLQVKMIAEIPRQPQSSPGLKVSWLFDNPERSTLYRAVQWRDWIRRRGRRLTRRCVQLAKQRQSRLAERIDPIASHDRFLHAIEGQDFDGKRIDQTVMLSLSGNRLAPIEVELGNGAETFSLGFVVGNWPPIALASWHAGNDRGGNGVYRTARRDWRCLAS